MNNDAIEEPPVESENARLYESSGRDVLYRVSCKYDYLEVKNFYPII